MRRDIEVSAEDGVVLRALSDLGQSPAVGGGSAYRSEMSSSACGEVVAARMANRLADVDNANHTQFQETSS